MCQLSELGTQGTAFGFLRLSRLVIAVSPEAFSGHEGYVECLGENSSRRLRGIVIRWRHNARVGMIAGYSEQANAFVATQRLGLTAKSRLSWDIPCRCLIVAVYEIAQRIGACSAGRTG